MVTSKGMENVMTQEQKAEAVYVGFAQVARQYVEEGDQKTAKVVVDSVKDLPEESAARLYDIVKSA